MLGGIAGWGVSSGERRGLDMVTALTQVGRSGRNSERACSGPALSGHPPPAKVQRDPLFPFAH